MWVTSEAKEKAFEKLMNLAKEISFCLPEGIVELQFDPALYRMKDSNAFVTIHLHGIQAFGNVPKEHLLEMINLSENFILKPISENEMELIFGVFDMHVWDESESIKVTNDVKKKFGLTDDEMNTPIEKF